MSEDLYEEQFDTVVAEEEPSFDEDDDEMPAEERSFLAGYEEETEDPTEAKEEVKEEEIEY